MSVKEIVDSLLKMAEILTAWPIILFIIFLLFKDELLRLLSELVKRLETIKLGIGEAKFKEVATDAMSETIEKGFEEYKDKPEKFAVFVREQLRKFLEPQEVAASGLSPNLAGRSILWVDDKPLNNTYESSLLKRLGASIVFARSTDEALTYLNNDKFDLIISDVHRDENGRSNPNAGYELLERIKSLGKEYPFIFYTGNVAYINKDRAQTAYGFADEPSKLIELAVRAL